MMENSKDAPTIEKGKEVSGFEKCLNSAGRELAKVSEILVEIRGRLKREDVDGAYASAFEVAKHAEKLTLLCRELPIYTGHPQAIEATRTAKLEAVPIEMGFTSEGWFCVRLPFLLPKKNKGSAAYIGDPLYVAMRRFWRDKSPVRFSDCVAIFHHIYARDRPKRQNRDHDNIELSEVLNIVALYVMTDDSPSHCRHYYTGSAGGSERTEVYVVPCEDFGRWLLQEKAIPEGGVTLYESRH